MTKVVAHFLVKEETWYLGMLLQSALKSVWNAVDAVLILDDGCAGVAKGMLDDLLGNWKGTAGVRVCRGYDGEDSFAGKHNFLINETDELDWALWLDADEVHHPEVLRLVCDVVRAGKYSHATRIRGYYHHFMRDPNHFRDVLFRNHLFFKIFKGAHWEGAVHERLLGPYGQPVDNAYMYAHYGYTKPREQVLAQWIRYDELAGQMVYDLSGKPELPKLDADKNLHGQFGDEGLGVFSGDHPEHVAWIFDGTLEAQGIKWTPEGQQGAMNDPDFLKKWRS